MIKDKARKHSVRTGGMLDSGGDHLFESDSACAGLTQWLSHFVSTSLSWDQLGEGSRSLLLCLRMGGEFDLPG